MTGKVYKIKTQTIRQISFPILLLAAVLVMPKACANGVREGLELCASVLIPSIFPALLATVIMVESGGAQWLGKKLSAVSKLLFAMPGEAASALVLSMLGGYPAGAKAVVGLYENGAVTKTQAQRMVLFCFSAGPAFLIGAVGAMAQSVLAGVVLLVANSISVVLVGILLGLILDRDRSGEIASEIKLAQNIAKVPFSQALVVSVQKAASSMLSICLFVVVFSVFRAMLSGAGLQSLAEAFLLKLSVGESAARAVLPALLEVSAGCSLAVKAGLAFTGFFIGFGGLAVHAQVWAIAHELQINKSLFFIVRMIQGMLTAGLTAVLLLFLPPVESAADVAFGAMPTAGGSALLMLLCVACVLCMPSEKLPKRTKKAQLLSETVL